MVTDPTELELETARTGALRAYPPVGRFVPQRRVEDVWEGTTAVVRAAIMFAGTWRRCYPECGCIRCDLAVKADALATLVSGRGK